MIYTVNESYSRGWVIATPELEDGLGALGAYEYPKNSKDIDDPARVMRYGFRANILRVRPVDLDGVSEGDFSVMDRYLEPIPDQVGAYAVHTTCHLFLPDRGVGINVYKTLFEFSPHQSTNQT